MSVKNIKDIVKKTVQNGQKTTIQVLISSEEGPHFAMRRFVMEPGGGMPNHTNTVEHEQFVLNGRAKIGIGRETREVSKGDIVYIPKGVPHWYQNIGDEDFEFICIIPNGEDVIEIIDKSC
jgi:quercetin dioxygenase-like cupin family protein